MDRHKGSKVWYQQSFASSPERHVHIELSHKISRLYPPECPIILQIKQTHHRYDVDENRAEFADDSKKGCTRHAAMNPEMVMNRSTEKFP